MEMLKALKIHLNVVPFKNSKIIYVWTSVGKCKCKVIKGFVEVP